MKESPVKIDVLLEPLLAETSDEQVDQVLSQLITVHAEPVIKGVIRFKLRLNSYSDTQRAEVDDIHQEAVMQLVAQLQRFRKLPDGHPISDMAHTEANRTRGRRRSDCCFSALAFVRDTFSAAVGTGTGHGGCRATE